ncbi:oxidoreductase [Marinobacter sp.]|uniref:NADH-quinone oxidoreductase subunit B family protein n=1 Tax=Marinobacter sp. TaxID=50741 RepID=UPI00384E75B2
MALTKPESRPRMAVHKFASCDGCQLTFLNLGETLLLLNDMVDIVHFPEAGPVAPEAEVDIAFIEGSITTAHDLERIKQIRSHSRFMVAFGACATAGGIQALRNFSDAGEWLSAVYAKPEYIDSLASSTPMSDHVKVDLEIWGCPPNSHQVLGAIRAFLYGTVPQQSRDKVCLECKRQQVVCVLVARGLPCMGPVTRTGCGALCPSFGRDCYTCYGPAEALNTASLAGWFEGLGLLPEEITRRFRHMSNSAPEFRDAARKIIATDANHGH